MDGSEVCVEGDIVDGLPVEEGVPPVLPRLARNLINRVVEMFRPHQARPPPLPSRSVIPSSRVRQSSRIYIKKNKIKLNVKSAELP